MAEFAISEVRLGAGTLGISPMPGRSRSYEADLATILRWGPSMVLTMATQGELHRDGAQGLGDDLDVAGVSWRHLPIPDYGAPPAATDAIWPDASEAAHRFLGEGGKVLAHCYGGCGRSGMALLRLMVETGEDVETALARLRRSRPCAVEGSAQRAWAAIPMHDRDGWTR